jgi:hypothetical protein
MKDEGEESTPEPQIHQAVLLVDNDHLHLSFLPKIECC